MSEIVESIERKALVFSLMKNTYYPKDFREEFVGVEMKYTPGFKGKQVARGVKLEDEKKVPALIREVGVDTNNPNWTEKSEDFWAEWAYGVPVGLVTDGKKIEGGTEIDGSYAVDKDGIIYPSNPFDYFLLNLMQEDDKVAKDIEEWPFRSEYEFFLIDKTIQQKKEQDTIKKTSDVYIKTAKLLAIEGKQDIIKYILQIYKKDISPIEILTYDKSKLKEALLQLSKENPDAILEAMKDEEVLSFKAFGKQLIHSGGISLNGNAYFYQNEKIASNDDELLMWIKNPENNGVIAKLQAHIEFYKTKNVIG